MIVRLTGTLIEHNFSEVIVDVQGVGYEVMMPSSAFAQLPASGEQLTILTHLVVREDLHTLYGFLHPQDKRLFRILIKANGVGPKLALGILSGIDAASFVRHVQLKEVTELTRLPGIGKRTAERLIVDLQNHLKDWTAEVRPLMAQASSTAAQPMEDAMSALVQLGYRASQARHALAQLPAEQGSAATEELVRLALQSLATIKQV